MNKIIKTRLCALLIMIVLLVSLNVLEDTIWYYIILGPILIPAGMWIVTDWFGIGKWIKCSICGKRVNHNYVTCYEGTKGEKNYCWDCFVGVEIQEAGFGDQVGEVAGVEASGGLIKGSVHHPVSSNRQQSSR